MKNNVLLGLSVVGLLFSGYLSGIKLFSDTCAFNERCPYFLGYPACYFGFLMYLAMVILLLLARRRAAERRMLGAVLAVALVGILFSGYFTLTELPGLVNSGFGGYALGLPTCAYGLILYLVLFALVAGSLEKKYGAEKIL